MEVQYVTSIREIFLLGFIFEPILEIILFPLFLLIYLVTVVGNALIIVLICIDRCLQTPMYFFLSNLSAIEIFMTTSVMPKMLGNLLSERKIFSFVGCFKALCSLVLPIQCSCSWSCSSCWEFILFAAMSFDRYMAICYPLRYPIFVTRKVCVKIVIGSWIGGFFSVFLSTVLKASAPLLHLACQDITMIELVYFLVSFILLLGSLSFTAISYIYIISTIVKIPSAEGRKKAFGTCASHFTVVSMGYGISIFVYVRPSQNDGMSLNTALAIFSGILTPFLNPFIFSLRNEQMKEGLRDVLKKIIACCFA
uniref:G-protein coupled receptors family 1 profile domain-containing protein n=1 Tax=Laticauda laticaudata TaxID=8630 RepID=A0A8C5RD59_LATLA